MAGKGKKRREKNYRAAHGGGTTRLPPPPTPSSLDAIPSKLRQIISFSAGGSPNNGGGASANSGSTNRNRDNQEPKNNKINLKNDVGTAESKENQNQKKNNKKRKRKEVKDLRFEAAELGLPTSSKRKERKKQRLEAIRMKKKRKANPDTNNNEDFPSHEEIKFGEVVQAPPKLSALPKKFNNAAAANDASKERLRLQAVEAYRNRKGWTSRPGLQLSPPVMESPLV